MDWIRFPPPILAIGKVVGLALGLAFGSISTMKYCVGLYSDFQTPTNTTLALPQQPTAVHFMRDSGPCPTCLFTDMEGRLLDYYGRPIDMDKLLSDTHQKPSEASLTMSLSIASTTTSTPISTGILYTGSASDATPSSALTFETSTSEPAFEVPSPLAQVASARHLSYAEVVLGIIEAALSWWYLPLYNYAPFIMNARGSGIISSRIWRIASIIAFRLAFAIIRKGSIAWFNHLRQKRKVQRQRVASADTNNALIAQLTDIIHEQSYHPAAKLLEIQKLLVAHNGDASNLMTKSRKGEARQPKVTERLSNLHAKIGTQSEGDKANEMVAVEERQDIMEARQQLAVHEGPAKVVEGNEVIDDSVEEVSQPKDGNEEADDGNSSRELRDLLERDRTKWSNEKSKCVAIMERQAEEINGLQFQVIDREQSLAAISEIFPTEPCGRGEKESLIDQLRGLVDLREYTEQRVALLEDAEDRIKSLIGQIEELQNIIAALRRGHGDHRCGLSIDIHDYDWQEIRRMASLISLPTSNETSTARPASESHRRNLGPHWHQQVIFNNEHSENDLRASSSQSNHLSGDKARPNWLIHWLVPANKPFRESVSIEERCINTNELSSSASDLYSMSSSTQPAYQSSNGEEGDDFRLLDSSYLQLQDAMPQAFRGRSDSDLEADPEYLQWMLSLDGPHTAQ